MLQEQIPPQPSAITSKIVFKGETKTKVEFNQEPLYSFAAPSAKNYDYAAKGMIG
jgi:hypothetical protein